MDAGFEDSQELQQELQEDFDPDYEPTREDVEDYAEVIGLDLNADPDLEWIAREGLCAPLPHGWKPVKDVTNDEVYYFNFSTGESIWDHPCDTKYREIYEAEKAKKTRKAQAKPASGGTLSTPVSGGGRWKKKGASKKKGVDKSPSSVTSPVGRPGTARGGGGALMARPKTAGRPGVASFDEAPPNTTTDDMYSPEVMTFDNEPVESGNSVLASMGMIDVADLRAQHSLDKPIVTGALDTDFDEPSDDGVPYDEVLRGVKRPTADFGVRDDINLPRGGSTTGQNSDDSFEAMRRESKDRGKPALAARDRTPTQAGSLTKPSPADGAGARALSAATEQNREEKEARLAEARDEAERLATRELEEDLNRLSKRSEDELQRQTQQHSDEKSRREKQHVDEVARLQNDRKAQLSKDAAHHQDEVGRLLKERESEITESSRLLACAKSRRAEAAATIEVELTTLETEYATKKKIAQQMHEVELTATNKTLAAERAKEVEAQQATQKTELTALSHKHALELERQKAVLEIAHKEALGGLETESKRLEVTKKRQTELDHEMAQKRTALEAEMEIELTTKRKEHQVGLSDEIVQIEKAHRTKKDDLRQKYRREEREDEERLRTAANENRDRVRKEEEDKLKELQSEVLALNDAVDEERRTLNADLDRLKENHHEHTRDLETELKRAQDLKAEMAANKVTLAECTREMRELEQRRDHLRRQVVVDEEQTANRATTEPSASALSLDDLEPTAAPRRVNPKIPTRSGKHHMRVSIGHSDGGAADLSDTSESESLNDSTDESEVLDAASEALYLQQARQFLANNGSVRTAGPLCGLGKPSSMAATIRAALDDSATDSDDCIEGVFEEQRPHGGELYAGRGGGDVYAPAKRADGPADYRSERTSAQASVVAAKGRARLAIDHWANDHYAATKALQGHSAWLSSFRDSLRESRKAPYNSMTAAPQTVNPYGPIAHREHQLGHPTTRTFPRLIRGADGHIRNKIARVVYSGRPPR